MAKQLELVLARTLPSTYLTLGREFEYLQKIRILPSRTFTQTLDLENFATAVNFGGPSV